MRYLSLFAGIEAASVAWEPLGFKPLAFAEIDRFPCAVLAHRFPSVPNLGDVTKADWSEYCGSVDIIIGGSPCQSFSMSGLRGGLEDPRGNLTLTYLAVVDRVRPRWIVWENVRGVLSSNAGRDFGTFLGGLEKLGYSAAWRVLDASGFGVPQQRRRVFLVGHLGNFASPAAVLFERESFRGTPPKVRKAGKEIAGTLIASTGPSPERASLLIVDRGCARRLTPLECERLQGFPDNWTLVAYRGKPAADGPRCKALGNSMAVPVVRWIGERIRAVDEARNDIDTMNMGS